MPRQTFACLRTAIAVALVVLMAGFVRTRPAGASTPPQRSDTQGSHPVVAKFGVYLPQVLTTGEPSPGECPAVSGAAFAAVPVAGPPTDRPPALHADLNLSLRGYSRVSRALRPVDIDGPADPDAPQLAGIAAAGGRPDFVEAYSVNQWNWSCQAEHGCRGDPIVEPPVTLLALAIPAGSPVRTPPRNATIYAGGEAALVLYAEENRITVAYTREGTAATGYVIHFEDICVDPELLNSYRELDAAGRSRLPALHSLEQLGTAGLAPPKVAVRDTGTFLDPRSRKDWWKGY